MKLIDKLKEGRCVMERKAINLEMAGFGVGGVSRLNNFFFGTGKEEGDGKADNYRARRMFSFRIQKMLGDPAGVQGVQRQGCSGEEDGSETNMLKWNLQIQDDGLGCKVNSRH